MDNFQFVNTRDLKGGRYSTIYKSSKKVIVVTSKMGKEEEGKEL